MLQMDPRSQVQIQPFDIQKPQNSEWVVFFFCKIGLRSAFTIHTQAIMIIEDNFDKSNVKRRNTLSCQCSVYIQRVETVKQSGPWTGLGK